MVEVVKKAQAEERKNQKRGGTGEVEKRKRREEYLVRWIRFAFVLVMKQSHIKTFIIVRSSCQCLFTHLYISLCK